MKVVHLLHYREEYLCLKGNMCSRNISYGVDCGTRLAAQDSDNPEGETHRHYDETWF